MSFLPDVPVPFGDSVFYFKPVLCSRIDTYFRQHWMLLSKQQCLCFYPCCSTSDLCCTWKQRSASSCVWMQVFYITLFSGWKGGFYLLNKQKTFRYTYYALNLLRHLGIKSFLLGYHQQSEWRLQNPDGKHNYPTIKCRMFWRVLFFLLNSASNWFLYCHPYHRMSVRRMFLMIVTVVCP